MPYVYKLVARFGVMWYLEGMKSVIFLAVAAMVFFVVDAGVGDGWVSHALAISFLVSLALVVVFIIFQAVKWLRHRHV